MATLASFLPAPTQPVFSVKDEHALFKTSVPQAHQIVKKQVPPYGQRQGFVPRTPEDFGDGGAFPEIHVAQYPLDMGNKKSKNSQAVVPLATDSDGRVKHEEILGSREGKKVFSQYTDLVAKQPDEEELGRPSAEDVDETTAKTRAALEKLVNIKIAAAQPSNAVQDSKAPTYIKYTPAQQGASFNSGANNRIIRMVEMPKDPMEPSKFKNKKVPKGPPSPPVPVMHSPPRKVTVKDQNAWKIPPCISNWKNSKGYTIPLDKRLAADGRGLQEVTINDKFAKISESLYMAERAAREEVKIRATINKKTLMKEKESKEDMLKQLAENARAQRGTGGAGAGRGEDDRERGGDRDRGRSRRDEPEEEEEEDDDVREREKIRAERGREREREYRLEAAGKKGKALRDEDRDIGEKIALGQAGAGPRSEESLFDQRLFNQTQGMGQGFGDEDDYNIYNKPLFQGSSANAMYRPKKGDEEYTTEQLEESIKTNKFAPDKGFIGADKNKSSEPRSRPVEFEKKEEDPFGLDEFLSSAKSGGGDGNQKRPLDKIGSRGAMHAGSAGSQDYQDQEKHAKRKKIDFDSSSSGKRR